MKIPLYVVDAFTRRVFGGNPAAVCPLDEWPDDATMQRIAMENNLSETAFFAREGDGFGLRWFTPTVEVDLCGHATLASAHVIFNHLDSSKESATFETRSGALVARRDGERIALDFPSRPARAADAPEDLLAALNLRPREVLRSSVDYLVVYESEDEVRALRPDMARLVRVEAQGLIATAPGRDSDCASRYFAPRAGIPEDPVTGAAHCTLAPFWAARLGRAEIHARQVSARGGEVFCEDRGERVRLAGHAARYSEGFIYL